MEVVRVSAYHVEPLENGQYVHEDGSIFDAVTYSRMKHGDGEPARHYGQDLAERLIDEVPELATTDKAIMTVPSYVYAPKPTAPIARAALTSLNVFRASEGVEPVRMFKLYASQMGTPQYAQLSVAEREAQQAVLNKQYHMPPTLIEDAVVFAVDDSIITGATERKQVKRISAHNPAAIVCAYAVELNAEKAASFPGIEHQLNMAAQPNLELVKELITSREFELNSRVLDLILSTEDKDALQTFVDRCPMDILRSMYEATMNSTLEFMGRNPESVRMVSERVASASLAGKAGQ